MANDRIKGITIELDGDATPLTDALKDVNKESKHTQTELKAVERALKMDPSNVELVRQKQELLTQSIQQTSDKLNVLRTAQSQVEEQFQRGEIGAEQYRAFQRELSQTEAELRNYQSQLSSLDSQQERFQETQRKMQTYLEATGQSVDDLSGIIGNRLTQAIKNGSASTDQLEMVLNRLARQAGHSGDDLQDFNRILQNVDGSSIDVIRSNLNQLNQTVVTTQDELKQIDQLLRFNPNDTVALTQKQQMLQQAINDTTNELQQLQSRQQQVEAAFASGDMGIDEYRAFQRELQRSEQSLQSYQNQLEQMAQEQQALESSTRSLQTYFQSTGTDVSQFADVLGNDLVRAIEQGRATSAQMEQALNRLGQAAGHSGDDLREFHRILQNAGNNNLDEIRRDLERVGDAAEEAQEDVKGLGSELGAVVGGLVAGGGIAGVISEALDVSSLNTQIDISMNLSEDDAKAVRQSIMETTAAIGDEELAYEGVRRQLTLNKDASIEVNQEIIKGAATIAYAYKEIDFKELIQESHEIGKELGISQKEALGLVNGLLDIGFPPEQLDIISEYGNQLIMAGYNAEQIQGIMAAGVDTGTWNIDILFDGLKEGRIVAAEFGQGVDKAMKEAIQGTNISAQQLEKWGQAVASGGQDGVKAMQEMNMALSLIDDDTKRNEIGVKLYGTLWEEQGGKISQTIQGMNEHIRTAAQNTQELNSDMSKLESDPAYQLSVAVGNVKEALAPTLAAVAEFVGKLGEWVSNNAELFAAITAIVAVVGILAGAFVAIMPAVGGLVTAWPVLVAAIGSISAPIIIAVAAIAALGVAFVALWQNSETFRDNLTKVFNAIKDVAVSVFEAVASFIGEKIAWIKDFWAKEGTQFLAAVENVFNGIMTVVKFVMPAVQMVIDVVWGAIKNVITGALNVIMGAVKVFSGLFTGDFSKMWEGVKQLFKGAVDLILGLMTLSFVGGIRALITNFTKTVINLFSSKWTSIVSLFKSGTTGAINTVKSMVSSVVSFVKNLSTNFVSLINTMKTNVVSKFTTLKDDIIAKVKSIDLLQVGKDLVNGLIKGITSMTSAALESITGIVDGVVNKAKSILKIASPSKVFKQIGAWTGEGLAQGIESTKKMNEQAITDIGKVLIKATEANAKEVSAIAKKAEEERTKLQKTYADKRAALQKTYADKSADLQKTSNDKSAKARNANAEKRNKLQKDTSDKIQALEKELQEKLKVINDKAWSDMQKQEAEAAQARLQAVVSFVDGKKQANELSLIDEAQYWRAAYKEFASGSDQYLALREKYEDNVNRINDAITSVNEKYLSEAQKINDELIKSEENLNKKYSDTLESRYNTIVNYFDLFGEVAKEEAIAPQTLTKNLLDQVDALESWASQIDKLKKKGLSTPLIDELEQLGPKAMEKLRALNAMTEKELQDYQSLYEQKMQLARELAVKELEPLKTDTQAQIQALRNTANAELTLLNTQWQQAIKEVVGGTETKLKTLNEIGKNAGQGLLDGLSSMQSALVNKSKEIADSISKTIQSALDIHSPSRVMKGFGVNIGQGLIVGMDDMLSKVAQSSVRLSDAVQNAHGSIASSANKSTANQVFYQQQVVQQSQNIDLSSLVAAITQLANQPIVVQSVLESRVISESVSRKQQQDYSIAAIAKGVSPS